MIIKNFLRLFSVNNQTTTNKNTLISEREMREIVGGSADRNVIGQDIEL